MFTKSSHSPHSPPGLGRQVWGNWVTCTGAPTTGTGPTGAWLDCMRRRERV